MRILRLFRTATLLLDEVDMAWHPLKSQWNYPVGKKKVSFTQQRAGETEQNKTSGPPI